MGEFRGGTTIGGYRVLTTANASDLLEALKVVDGTGSGLDADLLRGFYPTNSNTGNSIVSRDASGNFNAGTITATLSGNASTSTKWANARTLTFTGSVTGSGSIDGSGNVSIATTTNHTHSYLPLAGGTLTNPLTINTTDTNQLVLSNNGGTDVSITLQRTGSGQYDWKISNTAGAFEILREPGTGVFETIFNIPYNDSNAYIAGNKVWHAGNDGSGSGLDADLLDGLSLNSTGINNVANQVMRTEANGYAKFGWINTTGSVTTTAASCYYVETGSDGFLRRKTLAEVRAEILSGGTATSAYYSD